MAQHPQRDWLQIPGVNYFAPPPVGAAAAAAGPVNGAAPPQPPGAQGFLSPHLNGAPLGFAAPPPPGLAVGPWGVPNLGSPPVGSAAAVAAPVNDALPAWMRAAALAAVAPPQASGGADGFLRYLGAIERHDQTQETRQSTELEALRREVEDLREQLAAARRAPAMVSPPAGLAFDAAAVGRRNGSYLSLTLCSPCNWGVPEETYNLRTYCQASSLGRGTFGEVFPLANVTVTFDGRTTSDLVYKQILNHDDSEISQLSHEEALTMMRTNKAVGAIGFFGCTFNQRQNITGFLLEYAKGGDLTQFTKPSSPVISLRLLLEFMLDICRTISRFHEMDLIHRDIKPANILLAEPVVDSALGKTRVGDMGLARSDKVSARTRVAGTDSYMPPEALAGKTALIGLSFDIYSLGVLFFQLMTKAVIHSEDEASDLSQELHGEYTEAVRGLSRAVAQEKQQEYNVRWGEYFVEHCQKAKHKKCLDRYTKENPVMLQKAVDLASAMVSFFPNARPEIDDVVARLEQALSISAAPAAGMHR